MKIIDLIIVNFKQLYIVYKEMSKFYKNLELFIICELKKIKR